MPQFLLLIHDAEWAKLSPEQMQAVIQKFGGWMEKMQAAGVYHEGKKLKAEGRTVSSQNGKLVDGPFTETKELIGGYILIETDTIEKAVEFAKGCPSIEYGGAVQVRPLDLME